MKRSKKSILYNTTLTYVVSDYIELFRTYPNFSNKQYAVLFDVPLYKVFWLKKRIGLSKPSFYNNYVKKKEFDYELDADINWDNQGWFERMVGIGLNYLVKATGKNARFILRRVCKYGLQLPGLPAHACNYYEWLEYHYVVRKWSIVDCALFAGVSRDTMSRWLDCHNLKT